MNIRNITILIMTSVVLSACNSLPTKSMTESWSPSLLGGQVDSLLAYYATVRVQSAAELDIEHDKAKQQLAQYGTNPYRVRLALLLMLPNSRFHNDTAAIVLLNDVLKDNHAEPTPIQNFASYLLIKQNEQQRAVDEQMQRVRNEQKRGDELAQKLKDEQKRGDDLQVKVDAIKSMEKSMMYRDKKP